MNIIILTKLVNICRKDGKYTNKVGKILQKVENIKGNNRNYNKSLYNCLYFFLYFFLYEKAVKPCVH